MFEWFFVLTFLVTWGLILWPPYVSAYSNHPPQVLKNIPLGVERRISDNSANEELFNEAAPPYQTELDRCGYSHKLKYNPRKEKSKNNTRKKPVTWFNPPYSMDVATNVGREFLKLIDLHFPPGHILHPVINRSTVKVSYRALPNIGAQISKHNQKVLRQSQGGAAKPPPSCNCQKRFKKDCPIPGACNQDGVVYQATVTNNKGEGENYVGLAKNFKKRYRKHKDSLEKVNPNNSTTLSTYVWKEREEGREPLVSWKILEKNVPLYNPVTRGCKLCLREKFNIAFNPHLATLNSRNEIFGHCRHIEEMLVGQPPD